MRRTAAPPAVHSACRLSVAAADRSPIASCAAKTKLERQVYDRKGAMHSPLYDLTTPSSAGTEPGILAAERKPMMPSIAARPLLISVTLGR